MIRYLWIYRQFWRAANTPPLSLIGLWVKVDYGFPLDNEIFEIIGERENQIEVQGDFSAGTHNVCQSEWVDKSKIKQLGYLQPKLRR